MGVSPVSDANERVRRPFYFPTHASNLPVLTSAGRFDKGGHPPGIDGVKEFAAHLE